jgi:hypothetical protein
MAFRLRERGRILSITTPESAAVANGVRRKGTLI